MRKIVLVIALWGGVAGCSAKKPTAMSVCQKIEASGVGANCKEAKPEGLGAAAVARASFDLPSVPGKGGSVYTFDKDATFDSTSETFAKAAVLVGPHRYGSKTALVFVQMNEGLSSDDGKKVKAIVEGL